MSRTPAAVLVCALVTALVEVGASAADRGAESRRVVAGGVSVGVPGGWHSIRQLAEAPAHGVTDPVTRVVVASGPITFGPGCNQLDYCFPATAVAVVIVEWIGPTPGASWRPRPARFTAGNLPLRRGMLECFAGRGGGLQFAQGGRRFAAYVLAGRRASAAAIGRARSVLDSLSVRSR